jgi:hypothetical protein
MKTRAQHPFEESHPFFLQKILISKIDCVYESNINIIKEVMEMLEKINQIIKETTCSEGDFQVKELTETSVLLVANSCEHCTHFFQCKKDLTRLITNEFLWINQVRVI